MKRKIFFDLDGTLIDSSQRMYILFCSLNANCKMSYSEYWSIKRLGTSQKEMLKKYFSYTEGESETFYRSWMKNIEREDLLTHDKLFDDTNNVLKELSTNNDLFIVTARQNKDLTIKQVNNLGLSSFLKNVFVTERTVEKSAVIRVNVGTVNKDDIIVGDTKEDIETGIKLGIRKFAVTTGMLNHEKLSFYNSDGVYKNLREFYNDIC